VTLPNGGDIPAARSHQPLEIDDVYKSLSQLSKTLGPSEANKDGALSQLLNASAAALKGNGVLGNQMLQNLSGAIKVLGDNSPQLFSTVDGLSSLTQTLQSNDALVGTFLTRLAGVSTELGGESQNLQQALAAIASALGTVQSFIHDNRAALKGDLAQLTTTVKTLGDQRKTLGEVLQLAPLGLDNLTEAYDSGTGTEGIRLQLGPEATDLGNLLCGVLTVNHMPNVDTACNLLRALLPGGTSIGAATTSNTKGGAIQAPPGGLAGILDPALKGLLG
jgi:ABC-type transporter Mla subunit MlaD